MYTAGMCRLQSCLSNSFHKGSKPDSSVCTAYRLRAQHVRLPHVEPRCVGDFAAATWHHPLCRDCAKLAFCHRRMLQQMTSCLLPLAGGGHDGQLCVGIAAHPAQGKSSQRMHCQPEKVSDVSASAARLWFRRCMQNSQSVQTANRQCGILYLHFLGHLCTCCPTCC